MKKTVLSLFLLVFCVGCSLPGTKDAPVDTPDLAVDLLSGLLPSRAPTVELGRQYDVVERMVRLRVPGFGMAVIENDQIAWQGGHGHYDFDSTQQVVAETAFQAASMSKAVAAFGALVMVDQGLLDLDVPVNEYLTDWKIPDDEEGQSSLITMAHLLSHSAALTVHGFPGYSPDQKLPSNTQVLDGDGPANTDPVRIDGTVGEAFRYSGGGYTVAEQVMEEISGKDFAELMHELVLDPLGMNHSSFAQPALDEVASRAAPAIDGRGERHEDRWHIYPEQAAAGLWTTAEDYARFILGIAAALEGSEDALVSRELALRMITPVKDEYGLGVGVVGEGKSLSFRHGGSNYGYKCSFAYYPEQQSGIVVMTSADNGSTLASEIMGSAKRHLGLGKVEQEGIDVIPLPENYEALVGAWYIEAFDHTFRILNKNEQLWLEDDTTAPWQLHHIGGDTYRTMEERTVFTAVRNDIGAVESLGLELGSRTATANRIGP
ncbi:MAG: beta-lactamase family protein [bacterium]|nr:beta-lactamase family protein [bacterium]